MMWLAETKGEIRPNTALKSEAARTWCEKMSATAYGTWKYLFIQQRKLEAALTAGKKSLAELAAAIVELKPQPELVAEPPGHQLRAERVGFEPVGQ